MSWADSETDVLRKELFRKEKPTRHQLSDARTVAINNITSHSSMTALPKQQGAIIHSVATTREHKVHYGVQSATFVRTVFPGQASGTYRINGIIPTWQGSTYVSSATTAMSQPNSPPVPYPPRNASAYYSPPHTRIIPNPPFKAIR